MGDSQAHTQAMQLLSHMRQPPQPQQWQHQHTQLLYHMQPPQPQQWQPQPTLVPRMAMEDSEPPPTEALAAMQATVDSQPPMGAMEAMVTEDSHMALCSEARLGV